MKTSTVLKCWAAICGFAGATSIASAQTVPLGLNQSAWIQLQGFRPSISSTARLDNSDSGAAGTSLDFEDDLGLSKRETLGSLLAGVRLAKDWRAEFEYYSLKRSGNTTLDATITVDDTVYAAAADLNTNFDTTVYRGSLGYSFYRTPATEIGGSLGLHVTKVRALFDAIGSVNGAPAVERVLEREKTVPLPTLGFYATTALSDSWLLNARTDLLFLKAGGSKGTLLNIAANVIYRFTPNIGVGVGYRYVDYNLKRTSGSVRGELDYRYSGPLLLLDIGF